MRSVKSDSYSISELAREFSLSTRTIRFYEEKGLIRPERGQGNQRTFGRRDRARLKLILRGKRFGMTLDQILNILGRADVAHDETTQILQALKFGQEYLQRIKKEKKELEAIEREMIEHGEKCVQRLRELGHNEKDFILEAQKQETKKQEARRGRI